MTHITLCWSADQAPAKRTWRAAIGVQAIVHQHRRLRCFSSIELGNALEQQKALGKPGQMAPRLVHVDLVVLDELGYLSFSQGGGAQPVPSTEQTL